MYCKKCGNEIMEHEKICSKCGEKVVGEIVHKNIGQTVNEVAVGKVNKPVIISVFYIIVALLYFAPYYVVELVVEKKALNWFSSIKYAQDSDEKMVFYILAGSAMIAIAFLFASAVVTFLKNKINGFAIAALIISIVESVFVIFSLLSAINETEESFGGLGGIKITVVPYFILIFSIAGLIGTIKLKPKKNLK